METVFNAGNNIEAYMIANLLERSDISANVMGEHLQSAVGEIPAHGIIRVVVDPADAAQALEVIRDWEQRQVPVDPEEATNPRKKSGSSVFPFMLGAIIASAILLWAFNTPFSENAADHNRDGQTDEWMYWRNNNLSKIEIDRDFDGDIDLEYLYTPRKFLEKSFNDNDFDGRFEEQTTYKYNQPSLVEGDPDGDGLPDYKWHYNNGVAVKLELFVPGSRVVKKTLNYESGYRLTEAKLDTDLDGVFDTLIKYGPYAEEISRNAIAK